MRAQRGDPRSARGDVGASYSNIWPKSTAHARTIAIRRSSIRGPTHRFGRPAGLRKSARSPPRPGRTDPLRDESGDMPTKLPIQPQVRPLWCSESARGAEGPYFQGRCPATGVKARDSRPTRGNNVTETPSVRRRGRGSPHGAPWGLFSGEGLPQDAFRAPGAVSRASPGVSRRESCYKRPS